MSLSPEQQDEISQLREGRVSTRRATVEALEDILYLPFQVLDHGFVRVIDYMGDDQAIVQAARVSYGRGTKKTTQDQGLIAYLMRHRHSTPFEMCEIKFHIKLPIFVARQWIRHRTANVNEYSARYSVLDREFYLPALGDLAAQSAINNQGRGEILDPQQGAEVLHLLKRDAEQCYDTYETLLNEKEGERHDPNTPGLARELARMNLTLNYYTQWYWKIDLNNLFHFLHLRGDSHAQYEIRAYAHVMLDLVARWVPFAYEAFKAYRLEGAHFSKGALQVIQRKLQNQSVVREDVGLSLREWQELETVLGVPL